MGSSAVAFSGKVEGPVSYLPRGTLAEYDKQRAIYTGDQPATGIYLVLDGRVKVSRTPCGGPEVIVDIYGAGDIFGESSLLGGRRGPEEAVTLEQTSVTTWQAAEIEDLIAREPRLGVLLWRMLIARAAEMEDRIESLSNDPVQRRLARSLMRFSARAGTPAGQSAVQMPALTHRELAHYVGTSREIVSHDMSRFRAKGLLRYSRKTITLYPAAMAEWLRHG